MSATGAKIINNAPNQPDQVNQKRRAGLNRTVLIFGFYCALFSGLIFGLVQQSFAAGLIYGVTLGLVMTIVAAFGRVSTDLERFEKADVRKAFRIIQRGEEIPEPRLAACVLATANYLVKIRTRRKNTRGLFILGICLCLFDVAIGVTSGLLIGFTASTWITISFGVIALALLPWLRIISRRTKLRQIAKAEQAIISAKALLAVEQPSANVPEQTS